jgi:hypothetical protein
MDLPEGIRPMTTLLTLLDLVDARSPQLATGSDIGADVEDGSGGPALAADIRAGRAPALGADLGPAEDSIDPSPAVAGDVHSAPALGADLSPSQDGGPSDDN